MKPIGYILRENRLKLHIVFCATVLLCLFLGLYLFYLSGFRFHNLVSAFVDCGFFLFCIYVGRWLWARWYMRGAIGLFIGFAFLTVICLSLIKFFLVRYVFSHPYAGLLEIIRDAMPFFFVAFIMGISLKVISVSLRKELNESEARAMQVQSEFRLLQAQLSPHFLFNMLNTVYGISLTDSPAVPSLLLRLSSLLRYSVYSFKQTFVPLKDELEYLTNYIAFEQMRMNNNLTLSTDIEVTSDTAIKIAPLILIVFVENAFKHTRDILSGIKIIHIKLKLEKDYIQF